MFSYEDKIELKSLNYSILVLDELICHLWHSQWFFWMSMLISIWNLVLISFERFLAVCKPLKHQELTGKNTMILTFLAFCPKILGSDGDLQMIHSMNESWGHSNCKCCFHSEVMGHAKTSFLSLIVSTRSCFYAWRKSHLVEIFTT